MEGQTAVGFTWQSRASFFLEPAIENDPCLTGLCHLHVRASKGYLHGAISGTSNIYYTLPGKVRSRTVAAEEQVLLTYLMRCYQEKINNTALEVLRDLSDVSV